MREAVITRIVSNRYSVYFEGEFIIATAMGKLRLGDKPIVGDHVRIEELDGKWVIQQVLPRRNQLIRPLVANVDQALIVMSAKEPDFSFTLVNRLIFLVSLQNINPIIIVSKGDLADSALKQSILDEYEQYGYTVIMSGKDISTDALESVMENKISVLAGQSGVGKSSILNRISDDLELNTQEISKALGRGRHTTRHNQIYPLCGGWIADTPGFSSLDFSSVDPVELSQSIPDFVPFIGNCKYRDCMHIQEPGCIIKEKVESGEISKQRHQDYLDCLTLIKEESR
ncbi:ribosome small subunit-dependent GTPase A [Erysipelothrix rhusiopathiae]|uniref:ribosome small subunit-dependent GTPase A n=1 Tax=Erysipelothrix rhusiopathiae TaxID=1648 RepID=UPI000210B751|nr:ribosome small subunit-dependent GTPase A [Erysipelothrix rhusiopathiae]AGN24244.1 ribosome small subunit-dependent GTPase A [Erysipelothrix rhusiopathiae SY1027]AMS10989.1 ribosome small subunit-dependent GTPase [Erysipelothrix rhusiopathiae]AOO67487.1 ribosome small subunit-dependent GTPase A [Erysipelothrix rhusiopathiae]AWU41648.1 ribosome small subunit-dependent GTPase A [Erysipelothrix rhusiopathiae]MCG4436114.1 ribosome small subunit-dependent GTPase A [Erysipelothrix rhusiopathiae]